MPENGYVTLDEYLNSECSRLKNLVTNFSRSAGLDVFKDTIIESSFDHPEDIADVHGTISLSTPWIPFVGKYATFLSTPIFTLDILMHGSPIYDIQDKATGHWNCLDIKYTGASFLLSPNSSKTSIWRDYYQKLDPKVHALTKKLRENFKVQSE